MVKKILRTVVGGAIGVLSLYAVARVAYAAGKEAAESDQEETADVYSETRKVGEVPVKEQPQKYSKVGFFTGLVRARKSRALGDLVNHPEKHRFEAELDEDGVIRIAIRKKGGKK